MKQPKLYKKKQNKLKCMGRNKTNSTNKEQNKLLYMGINKANPTLWEEIKQSKPNTMGRN